ncbi:hypothetical protein BJX96DRAFT_145442 [Aspergillus floccosus]
MDEPYARIDDEVLKMFEKAGSNLNAQDLEAQTLLHVVVKKDTMRTYRRILLLFSKGLDPMLRNAKGETAIDVAMNHEPDGDAFFTTMIENLVKGMDDV